MRILDLSAGYRAIWFDPNCKDAVFVDSMESVRPHVVADSRLLPFGDRWCDLVVFDPPHVNGGRKGNISRDYGWHTTEEIRDIVCKTAREAHRVTKENALMAFKWNDHDQRLGPVVSSMFPWWLPLFGHKVAQRTLRVSSTHWVMLRRGK